MECFLYFFFTHDCILEHSPTLGLLHGVFDEIHHAFMAEFILVSGVGAGLLTLFLSEKSRLQSSAKMFIDCFFCILLHLDIYCGINFKTVGIYVIVCAVRLRIL